MKKNLVAMLLAVGVITTATGCGSTESTSTTSTTEYVTEETTTEEAQVEETTEYVETEAEEVEAAEEINVDELVIKVREAMEAVPYVVSDYTVLVNGGSDNNYKSFYNKELNTIYYSSEGNLPFWVDLNSDTLYVFDKSTNTYLFCTSQDDAEGIKSRSLNIDDIYRTVEEDSAVYTLDDITDGIATLIINYVTNGNNATAVMTINTETGLIKSGHYTAFNESEELVYEVKLELSYPTEGTPEYDEFIQKTTIPAEAIEAANNQ